jgi:murein DD-endopeptidase MepM/ murein hydrolase activator NlpD
MGSNVILILGNKWRFYCYKQLQHNAVQPGQWRMAGDKIGTVGSTGNAQGKPPPLHFAVSTIFPGLNLYDPKLPQAWQKIFYIDPHLFLLGAKHS